MGYSSRSRKRTVVSNSQMNKQWISSDMQQPELQKRKYKCTNKWYTPYRDTNFGTLPYTRCTTQQETAEITHTYTTHEHTSLWLKIKELSRMNFGNKASFQNPMQRKVSLAPCLWCTCQEKRECSYLSAAMPCTLAKGARHTPRPQRYSTPDATEYTSPFALAEHIARCRNTDSTSVISV